MPSAHSTPAVCLVAPLLATLPGCASSPFGLGGRGRSTGFTQEDLRDELDAYATRFGGLVASASEEIAHSSTNSTIDRRAVLWQMRLIPAVREAAFLPDPRQGYLRALTIAVMMHRYFTAGDGKALFGEGRPFDIREWEAAANAIGADAAELRGLASELRGFSASAGLDRLFWRAAALLVLFFALLLACRLLAARLLRRSSTG